MSGAALETVWQIWSSVVCYTVATSTCCFFAAGVAAAVVHFSSWPQRWLVVAPLFAALAGSLIAFLVGAVPSAMLAVAVCSTEASMSRFPGAAVWGVAQGVFITLLNAKVFSRIV
jgi:uncharacterized protein YacL